MGSIEIKNHFFYWFKMFLLCLAPFLGIIVSLFPLAYAVFGESEKVAKMSGETSMAFLIVFVVCSSFIFLILKSFPYRILLCENNVAIVFPPSFIKFKLHSSNIFKVHKQTSIGTYDAYVFKTIIGKVYLNTGNYSNTHLLQKYLK